MVTVVKSACRMCRRACGIDVHLQGETVVAVKGSKESPVSQGVLCPKGRAAVEFLYSPSRLRYPLKRTGTSWQRIEWQEALDTIAMKLEKVKQEYGARALAVLMGESASQCDAVHYVRRFLDVYGSPNLFSGGSLCYRPIPIACRLTFGRLLVPEAWNSRCILIWGANPYHSNRPLATQILSATRAGAKLAVIDPRRTFFARRADIHLQPKPGSDLLVALAMLNVIISAGLYDKEFVSEWTTGFEKLKEHLTGYTPGMAEEAAGIPEGSITALATMFATNRPAAIIPGAALFHQRCAVQNLRAISLLQAVTGNVDVPGGWVTPPALRLSNMSLPEMLTERPLGEAQHPLFVHTSPRLEGQAAVLGDTILTGKPYPVKAMFIAGGNPAVSWPDTTKVVKALKKLDFLMVMDITMTRTAELANLVLPAATFLETTELHTYNELAMPYAILRQKTAEIAECWTDWKLWFKLAERMGYREHFPWADEEAALVDLLKPSGLTLGELKAKSAGVYFGSTQYKTYQQKGFPTPSGKVELYSSKLEEMGHHALPTPLETVTSEETREYPLLLIAGVRSKEYTHSQFRYIASLRQMLPEPFAEINPTTAAKHGVAASQMIDIETRQGKVTFKARVTGDIAPDVISIPFGWAQADTNILTDWQTPDPLSGLPTLVGLPCRIARA